MVKTFFCYECNAHRQGNKGNHKKKVHQKSVLLSLKVSPVSMKFPTTNARHCTVHKTEEVWEMIPPFCPLLAPISFRWRGWGRISLFC